MKLRSLFASDVTRDISPVVYFHEQSPAKLAEEVREYIITGGFDETHPHHKRVPNGIHEQYVRLLTGISAALDSGNTGLPASWISGFYGSGKSSFAKLLGLALDGVALPDGRSLAQAWLERDTSPRAKELRDAYAQLRAKIDPIAVVFDIGGVARDNEHIHTAAVRMIQRRLGYSNDPHVAEMELKLERDGHYPRFQELALEELGQPWSEACTQAMADDAFSTVIARLFPERYTDPMAWLTSRAGTYSYAASVEEASRAIADMLKFRRPNATLFVVIDEVSQYVHQDTGRMLKLQSFVSDLGQRHRGKVWLLATGQEKLEEGGEGVLAKMKDRFPAALRVHLAVTNIRDVVHKRLLAKTPEATELLRDRFQKHRNELRLFAYDCDTITEDDFVEVYPMLPGHIDLILQITSALRTRSTRSQGDDQAIRGLLQLLGELFRSQKLADAELGALVTLDQIYEVQHTALDSDIQASMARIQHHCATHAKDGDRALAWKAARAVALLELIQERVPTDARLVAACLYDRLDRGSQVTAVQEALEELRRANLLGYSEKQGYKIQSTSGEEWERERRDLNVSQEQRSELIQDQLRSLVSDLDKPRLDGRPFPWLALFSDGRRASDVRLVDQRDPAAFTIDVRMPSSAEEREPAVWIARSTESLMTNRLIWVAGDTAELEEAAKELGKSTALIKRYEGRSQTLPGERQRLWHDERNRRDHELQPRLRRAVEAAWLDGRFYFRGAVTTAREIASSAGSALLREAERVLRALFPHLISTRLSDAEVMQLIETELNAPSPKFLDELGILELENGRYIPACSGVVPQRVLEYVTTGGGATGAALYQHFGGPPYGYPPEVVRACVAGLLRASRIKIQPDVGDEITATRDAGVRDVLDKERGFKAATIFPVTDDGIGMKGRARICKFFEARLGLSLDREANAIAEAVSGQFPLQMERLRGVFEQLRRLPGHRSPPEALIRLEEALQRCYKLVRHTDPTVREVARQLDALNDGIEKLGVYAAELTPAAVDAVCTADDVARYQLAQLVAIGHTSPELEAARARIEQQLASEAPWRGISRLADDLALVTEAYREVRHAMLAQQETAAEAARARVKLREGFALLTADQSHHVLRPITEARVVTDETAISPSLEQLRDRFERALPIAESEAIERLDKLRSDGKQPLVRKVTHQLANREIASLDELERVLAELRERVTAELTAGHKVRLV